MAQADEEDWEYEYDPNETEDFYITLDLAKVPRRVAAAANIPARGAGGRRPIRLATRVAYLNAGRDDPMSAIDSHGQPEYESMGTIQITGLHTTSPLIMYNGTLFSCKWVSTIGTDMFFVQRDTHNEQNYNPIRSTPGVDLLAMSSTRLEATPAVLRPREELFDAVKEADAMEISGDDSPVGHEEQPTPSDFLAKLNQVKARMGEPKLVATKTSDGSRLVVDKEGDEAIFISDGAASEWNEEDVDMDDLADEEQGVEADKTLA
ncbi:hypothetical protein BCR34DRAFT_489538 [Clohesyomyces aquaticus]|uniref:Transcription factor TFIIIC triple barrel domain-containing protein n=1 Tax=Clohesyomyces aquaticus TaxID=1231657 RepID=A0A1Y1ZAH9_9PLEO|nr:hypothetical protein BCR34DRAFT_489538 [Clohesyomyces aquaticus]